MQEDKNKKTCDWDALILRLRSYPHFTDAKPPEGKCGRNWYRASSYYDEMQVHPVNLESEPEKKPLSVLESGYNAMRPYLDVSDEMLYQSQHLILAFRKSNGKESDFWKKDSDLLFVTMVNVGMMQPLGRVVKRIEEIFCGESYLIYRTLEYNELIVFCKGSSLASHSKRVMQLNFGSSEKDERNIIDTITMCGFKSGVPVKKGTEDQEKLNILLRFGVKDYQQLLSFLKENGCADDIRWVLGRNDVEVSLPESNLDKLRILYRKYRDKIKAEKGNSPPFLITAETSIANQSTEEAEKNFTNNRWEGGERKVAKNVEKILSEELRQLKEKTKNSDELRQLLGNELVQVSLRVLNDLRMQIVNIQRNQLADDLAICLLPQYESILKYLQFVWEAETPKNVDRDEFMKCMNAFYLSMASLINSTVHSSRQFIQVPHCGATSFEMPPKVMACYVDATKKIIESLRDDDTAVYGYMLSPKMVNELDVMHFPIRRDSEPNQVLSVSIGEHMLYDPVRTVVILGHEMAHFVGENARMRNVRRNRIMVYYIHRIIRDLTKDYFERMPVKSSDETFESNLEVLEDLSKQMLEYSERMADKFFPEDETDKEKLYKNKLLLQIEALPGDLLRGLERGEELFEAIILSPDTQTPLFSERMQKCLPQLPDGMDSKQTLKRNCAKFLFEEAIEAYKRRTEKPDYHADLKEEFDELIGHIFCETYADIVMILLFKMKQDDYEKLYNQRMKSFSSASEQGQQAYLLRYYATLCALYEGNVWSKPSEIAGRLTKSDDLEEAVRQAGKTDDFMQLCKLYGLDELLLVLLVDYLIECVTACQEQFEKKKDAVKQVRYIYNALITEDPDRFFDLVREQEKELYAHYIYES